MVFDEVFYSVFSLNSKTSLDFNEAETKWNFFFLYCFKYFIFSRCYFYYLTKYLVKPDKNLSHLKYHENS